MSLSKISPFREPFAVSPPIAPKYTFIISRVADKNNIEIFYKYNVIDFLDSAQLNTDDQSIDLNKCYIRYLKF